MTPKEVLVKAKDLIADRRSWIQGTSAADHLGIPLAPEDPIACRFCSIGAIERVLSPLSPRENYRLKEQTLNEIESHISSPHVIGKLWRFNDSHTHEGVMALFDKSIKEAP